MKRFKFIVLLVLFFSLDTHGQDMWDSVIARIQNNQLTIDCYNSFATLTALSNDVNLLVAAGKKITTRIVPLLDNEQKGIVAHYILTRIWKEKNYKPVRYYAENTQVVVIEFHGLTFRITNGREFLVPKEDIEANKARWLAFLPKRYR